MRGISPMQARIDLQTLQDNWRTSPNAIFGQALSLMVLLWLIRDWPLAAWQWLVPTAGLTALWIAVTGMARHFRRFGITASGYRRWRRALLGWHLMQGTLWGALAVALLAVADADWKLALVAAALVYAYTVMLVSVHDWGVALAGSAPLLLLAMTQLLIDGQPASSYLALVMGASMGTSMVVTRHISRRLREGLLLRNENADLVLQLREEVNNVTRAKARAEIADRQKGEFFASVSHDLRQPLHVLMLLSSALRPHLQAAEGHGLLDKMQTALGSLSMMFERMFDVARIDAQRIDYHPKACALGDLWRRLDSEFAVLCAHKGLRWQLDETEAWAQADPHVLERILRNLLNNAVRYTDTGGVRLRARTRGPWVVCQVWDSGMGVDRTHRHRIFEDYFQAHNDGRRSSEGLGLGLAVVRRLSLLGPTPVSLRSRPGRGSCFSVRLPRLVPASGTLPRPTPAGRGATEARQAPPQQQPRSRRPASPTHAPGVLLLIEDDPEVREGTAVLLNQHGWLTAAASTPEGAVAALVALQQVGQMPDGAMPAALISDHRLGLSINGLQAIQQLRYEFGEDLPAFLLTGEATPGLADEARGAKVHLLHKPLQADRLLRLLDKATAPGDPTSRARPRDAA